MAHMVQKISALNFILHINSRIIFNDFFKRYLKFVENLLQCVAGKCGTVSYFSNRITHRVGGETEMFFATYNLFSVNVGNNT
jgi:hypothetical protein